MHRRFRKRGVASFVRVQGSRTFAVLRVQSLKLRAREMGL